MWMSMGNRIQSHSNQTSISRPISQLLKTLFHLQTCLVLLPIHLLVFQQGLLSCQSRTQLHNVNIPRMKFHFLEFGVYLAKQCKENKETKLDETAESFKDIECD